MDYRGLTLEHLYILSDVYLERRQAIQDALSQGDLSYQTRQDLKLEMKICEEVSAQVEQRIRHFREEDDISYSVQALIDIAVSIAAAGGYEAAKAGISRQRRRADDSRAYSEKQLTEFAQRALASRLCMRYASLTLRSIKTTNRTAIASFKTAEGHGYKVAIEMIDGVAVVKRLQHQIPPSNVV